MNPLVSVIIPVYNLQLYIKECIQSIVTQTYSNLEILVIDDASTDDTVEIVESFKDLRIKILRNKINVGLAASVNKAIQQSSGELLARMDGDDIAAPTRIAVQVEFLLRNPAISILGTAMKSFGYGKFVHYFPASHEECKARLLFNVCFGHPTVMLRRRIFDNIDNLYDESLKQYSEEYDLWCRLVDRYQFANLTDVLLYYRTYPPNQKLDGAIKRRSNSYSIRCNFLNKQWQKRKSEEIFKIHDHVANLDTAADQRELMSWVSWLEDMESWNRDSNLASPFQPQALSRELDERIFEIYYWNAHLGLASWFRWQGRDKKFKPGIAKQVKFFLKSVLRK